MSAAPAPTVTVAAIEAATEGVLARLAGDPRAPSTLPGWTVGHVLTHVARNADAFVRVAEERRAGRPGVMYPHGEAGRGADIDAGAHRPMAELRADIAEAGARFAEAWREPVPDGPCASWLGLPTFPASEVPLRRLREVEVHAVDTGLPGCSITGWTDAYVDADLPVQLTNLPRRTREPIDTGLLDAVDRRALLAWLLDRVHVDGLPTLLAWSRPDTWLPASRL